MIPTKKAPRTNIALLLSPPLKVTQHVCLITLVTTMKQYDNKHSNIVDALTFHLTFGILDYLLHPNIHHKNKHIV